MDRILRHILVTKGGLGTGFAINRLSFSIPSNTSDSENSWPVIDVRDLYDDDSNSLEDYDKKINLVWSAIQSSGKAAICCLAGISRSNAIALGVLVKYFNMDFYEASELVKEKVARANISPVHIEKLKKCSRLLCLKLEKFTSGRQRERNFLRHFVLLLRSKLEKTAAQYLYK